MSVSILVVDDEPDVSDLFRQRFRREVREGQYVIHFALSAEEALDKLSDGVRPGLIVLLSDINMPGMDGLGAAARSNSNDMPVLFAGDHGDGLRRRRAPAQSKRIRCRRVRHQTCRFRPVKAASPATATAVTSGRNGVTEAVKILAVDDEPDFETLNSVQRFRQRIRAGNLEFRFARHGEEALAVLADEPDIALLLVDINMPVMDGLALLAELRARQSAARAVIVSAYGDMANIRTAMNRGAFDFVTKPVDLNDLELTIDKTLESIAHVRGLDRQRAAAERARTNLARYFSPNLVEMLAHRDEPLGPVRRETVAVLFVDIVGFTGMAENMPPESVVTLLREFHERMAAQIFACGGTVEKYIGDEIFAVFGLLKAAGSTDAANALRCASGMLAALDAWNGERAGRGEPALSIGIGLNYGPAVMGDVGSDQGFSFTVIGDTVNTASRLQGLTRDLKTPLVVADAIVSSIDGAQSPELKMLLASLLDQGEQALKGRSGAVRIWTRPTGSDRRA